MRIAITGTHGTGKTTLAQALVDKTGLPLISEQARIVAQEMEFKECAPFLHNPAHARKFQWGVLERQIAQQTKHKNGFIADRSTLDSIAYWLLYMGDDPKYKNETNRYIFKARLHAWKNLDLLVYLPPMVMTDADSFRLKDNHITVDLAIRREVKLLQESGRVPVLMIKGTTINERLNEIEVRIKNIAGFEYLQGAEIAEAL